MHAMSFLDHTSSVEAFDGSEALSCRDLSVSLGQTSVLKNIQLTLPSAQWLSVVGPNGAGKSTLLRALAGLIPYTGEVLLRGKALQAWLPKQKAQALTWMGQEGTFVDDLSVRDVVCLGRLPYQKTWSTWGLQDEESVQAAMDLTRVGGLQDRSMSTLSSGQVQRVLLARALSTRSGVLLLDEPIMALDPPFQSQWIAWMRALVAQGVTVVTVLHDLNVALAAQSMLILNQGEMAFWGDTKSPDLHRSLERVFEGSVQVLELSNTTVQGKAQSVTDAPTHHVILRAPSASKAL